MNFEALAGYTCIFACVIVAITTFYSALRWPKDEDRERFLGMIMLIGGFLFVAMAFFCISKMTKIERIPTTVEERAP